MKPLNALILAVVLASLAGCTAGPASTPKRSLHGRGVDEVACRGEARCHRCVPNPDATSFDDIAPPLLCTP
ncbi:hypothetical protein ACFJGW_00525 [Burkholderiaceae bacterium UC74_6]